MHVLVYMTERQFKSVVCMLKTGEEQLLYNVLFWYMDYYAMSLKMPSQITKRAVFLSLGQIIPQEVYLEFYLTQQTIV